MIVNPYKNIFGKLKISIENSFPSLISNFLLPYSLSAIDNIYRKSSYKRSLLYLKQDEFPIFKNIEIETINRCNGTCSFCNVNRNVDSRPLKLMDKALFKSIIYQLKDLNYSSELALYSNNEPLLDKRIFDFLAYAKEQLPLATHYLYTNGTLLTKEKFITLMEHLDYLIIDNYNDSLEIIEPVKALLNLINTRKYHNRVIILLRKQNELLFNRTGDTQNRSFIKGIRSSCIYPFQQMVIRPSGKVSLCCNDSHGKMTLGDTNYEGLMDIWQGSMFKEVRSKLAEGRYNLDLCRGCDTIVPEVVGSNPISSGFIKNLFITKEI